MEKTARTKLSERNMHWDETYTENTEKFKEMYEDIIGEGSYFRWEGKDVDSGDKYFVIVGPAKMKTPKASWFAGCRKLPSDWAAGGKYFSEIKEAMNYANETWGVTIPSDFKWSYDSSDLKDISDKMDEWREERIIDAKGDNKMSKLSSLTEFPMQILAGGPPHKGREGYVWFEARQLLMGDSEFEELKKQAPSLEYAKNAVMKERNRRKRIIAEMYGEEYVESDFYQIFLGHGRSDGKTYIYAVGPYCGTHFGQAFDKFGAYRRMLNFASDEEIEKEIEEYIASYMEEYGVHLNREDVRVKGKDVGDIVLDLNPKTGKKKVEQSEGMRRNIDYYKNKHHVTTDDEAYAKFQEEAAAYKSLKEAYDRAVKNGTAFTENIPKPVAPPGLRLKVKNVGGQKTMSAIYREPVPKDMPDAEKMYNFGFDSLKEAVDNVMSTMSGEFPIQKISEVKNITSADLKKIRTNHDRKKNGLPPLPEDEIVPESESDTIKIAPQKEDEIENLKNKYKETIKTPKQEITPPQDAPVIETTPQKENEIEQLKRKYKNIKKIPQDERATSFTEPKVPAQNFVTETPPQPESEIEQLKKKYKRVKKSSVETDIISKTILNLVKLAETLDNENKPEDAEEIHNILRKNRGKQHD